jgi:hypothetical protein
MSDTSSGSVKQSPKGSRKQRVSRETSLIILFGFIIASWMKCPVELFVAFVVGVSGTAFSFMWGNSNEHRAAAAATAAAAVIEPK